jgi:ATP-dependent 26S proteasome regulatory subunit
MTTMESYQANEIARLRAEIEQLKSMKIETEARIEIVDTVPTVVIETRNVSGTIRLAGDIAFSKLQDGQRVTVSISTITHRVCTEPKGGK